MIGEEKDDIRIIFFGSPLVDITAKIDEDFLKKYQLERDNAYVVDDNNRAIFDDIREKCSVRVGGSVTNTARVVRKLRGSSKYVTYLGTIGNDDYGKLIRNQLDEEGLGSELMEINGNTGKVAVLLMNKARTLVTDLGVSRVFSLDNNFWQKMKEPCLIYLSAFFISVSYETITHLISTKKTFAFNLGAPFLSMKYPQEMLHIYRHSSIIFGNESEHRSFAKIHNITSDNLIDVIIATNQRYNNTSRVIVATRGGGSVLVVQDSDWQEFEVRTLEEDKVVDSNGAGDAFVGGFLARYVAADSISNCVKCGIDVARSVIQTIGFNLDVI